MLRLPSIPIAPQIVEADKYVCPPWLHPLSCIIDSRNMVPESVANNGDHAWEELKKTKVFWFLLPLPLMFLWDYMKNRTEIVLPHKRISKNPIYIYKEHEKVGKTTPIIEAVRKYLNAHGLSLSTLKLIEPQLYFSVRSAPSYHIPDQLDKHDQINKTRISGGGIIGTVNANASKKTIITEIRRLVEANSSTGLVESIKRVDKNKQSEDRPSFRTTRNPINRRRKNPDGRCTYQAVVKFRRGNETRTADMMMDAWSLTEAKNKFQDIIDKKLRNATLQSLQVERVLC